ncbi:elongation factor G [Candidatus Bipolaricaulota bacterium]|nr:elongation factor G [Candidatus Bipolaricaulota bacterium]
MANSKSLSLIGHSGTGKSKLAEKFLKISGIDGDITFDPSQEEKDHGHSIDLGVGSFKYKGQSWNLLDTPGAEEFVEEVYKGVFTSEASLMLLDSEKGVQAHTEKVWNVTQKYEKPTGILVNKVDLPEADFEGVMADLREQFDKKFVVLQIPILEEGEFVGFVDVLEEKAVYFDGKEGEIPGQLKDELNEERENLLESLAEVDDDLMMKYLEEEEITEEDTDRALDSGFEADAFSPVFVSSVEDGKGLDVLLDSLTEIVPDFKPDSGGRSDLLVFNKLSDPYLGKLAFVKVYGEELQEGASLRNLRTDQEVDVTDLYRYLGGDQESVHEALQGDVVALGKLDDIALGDTLTDTGEEEIEFVDFPGPVYDRAVNPKSREDESKMSTALKELVANKATITYHRDDVTEEMILSGMGANHLEIFKERLKNGFNVEIDMTEPNVPYKQSIAKEADTKYRHKKQSGGRGQYGEVYLRLSPLPRGSGFEFVNEIKGGNIPTQFIPGVEKGIQEALDEEYPMTDVKATVYDGDHHPVDSSEMAFKIAGREACNKAVEQAGAILLEPIMKVKVTTPGDFTGDIISDLNGRRGRILGSDTSEGNTVINAEVPQAEVMNYATRLKSLTQAKASFQMEFVRYKKVPSNIASNILDR